MDQNVSSALQKVLNDWKMMQCTNGEEGAEWAERFERHFYEFIAVIKKWMMNQKPRPQSLEEAENIKTIQEIEARLPTPLLLNFTTELEAIVDGEEWFHFD